VGQGPPAGHIGPDEGRDGALRGAENTDNSSASRFRPQAGQASSLASAWPRTSFSNRVPQSWQRYS